MTNYIKNLTNKIDIILLIVIVLCVFPYILIFMNAFGGISSNFNISDNFISYKKIFIYAYVNSIFLASISSFICILIACPVAYYIAKQVNKNTGNFIISLMIIPFLSSILIRIYSWIILLRNSGIINNSLIDIGIISSPLNLINNYFAVIIGMVFVYLPFAIIPLISYMEKIPNNIIEASYDLGASSYTTFRKIILPMSMHGVISSTLLIFTPMMGEYMIPEMLGGSSIITIGKLLWVEFFISRNMQTTCLIALSITILLIIPTYYLRRTHR